MTVWAIVGGTGIDELPGLELDAEHHTETPFGVSSGTVREGRIGGRKTLFLQRHGGDSAIPPHLINYRANIWALQSLGATQILAIHAVGGIASALQPGALLIPDQLIDYTWGREHSFDTGGSAGLMHVDFTEPYSSRLRRAVIAAAATAKIRVQSGGVMGVTQGPRLETAAEIVRMARDGCDVVGMTGMPEAALARELGIDYQSLCMIVNPAAGLGDGPISLEAMRDVLEIEAKSVQRLLVALIDG